MKESYSGLFKRDPSVPFSGLRRIPSGGHKEFGKPVPNVASKEEPKRSHTHSSNVKGKEELHHDAQSAINRVKGKGGFVTRLKDQSIEYKESDAKAVAKELSESWWCGTPEVMERERKKKAPPFTTNMVKGADLPNMSSDDKMNLESVVEAAYKAGKASKAKKPKATKPNKVATANNEDPAMEHAKRIMKMANCVSKSVYAGPLDILAAAYAKDTFHPDKIGEVADPIDAYIDEGLWGDIKAKVRDAFSPKIKVNTEGPVVTKKGTSSEKAVNMGAGKAYKLGQMAQSQGGFLSDTTMKHGYGSKLPNTDIAKSYGELERHPEKAATATPKTYAALKTAFSGNKPIQPEHRAKPSTHVSGTVPVTNPEKEARRAQNRYTANVSYQSLSKDQRKRFDVGEAIDGILNKFLEDTMTGNVASIALGFAPVGMLDPKKHPEVVRPGGTKKRKKTAFNALEQSMIGGPYHKMSLTPYHKLARVVSSNMSGV